MSSAATPRAVVIGAGVVGLACAARLTMAGRAVTVLDPQPPGMGCSYGNAGCFSLASFVPIGMPGLWRKVPGWLMDRDGPLSIPPSYAARIAPWLWWLLRASSLARVERTCDEMHDFLGVALDRWRPLAAWAGVSELVQRNGWAVVYESEAAYQADALGWRLRRERGVEIHVLQGAEIRELEPALGPHFTHMAYLPEQGQCPNPLRLSQALAATLERHGARFERRAAVGFDFRQGRVRAVRTEAGAVEADEVVVAAGAHSAELAAKLGSRIPLETERGYHAMVEGAESARLLTRPVMSGEGKFFATPMEDGMRFAGSVELGGLRAPPDYRRADILLRKGRAMLPALPQGKVSRWMGMRPSLPDTKPAIGRAPGVANAFFAFGHGHTGLTGAAATGGIVADLAAGREPDLDIRPFDPARFGR